jgi:5-methylcytosine-specific restriction protein A
MASVRQAVQYVLEQYPGAMAGPQKDSAVAAFLRRDFPTALREVVDPVGDFIVKGSPGGGQWARSPWVAIFNPLITDTAQRGYYPVYLFREDFSGVYLSLNQGVTAVKNRYHARAKQALSARAIDFRARLGALPPSFSMDSIDLKPSSSDNDSAFYEAANICATFYDGASVPTDSRLTRDLTAILGTYSAISDADPDLDSAAVEGDEPRTDDPFDEDHTRLRAHRRIERNPAVSKRVKKAQGLVCKACEFDFRSCYPGIERNEYIEAHHLVPIAELKGQKVKRDPFVDFAVLCANCHRMIHRSPEPWNLEAFKTALRSRNA